MPSRAQTDWFRLIERLGLAARAVRGFVGVSTTTALVAALTAVAIAGPAAARGTAQPRFAPAAAVAEPPSQPTAASDPDDPKQAGHFAGRVLGPDGRPIAGARLFVVPSESMPSKPGPVRASTGADGRFAFDAPDMTFTEIDGLPGRQECLLIATADGYQPDWVVTWGHVRFGTFRRKAPVKGADVTLRLSRVDVPIHGRLLDQQGQPLAAASVRVSTVWFPPENSLEAHLKKFQAQQGPQWPFDYDKVLKQPAVLPGVASEAIADADGRFQISGLGRDRLVQLEVTAPTVVDTDLIAMTRDSPDVVSKPELYHPQVVLGAGFTTRLKPGRTVRGIVRDGQTHAPIPGMWVHAGSAALGVLRGRPCPFSSDAIGRYAVSGIDPAVKDLEVFALPQPGQPYFVTRAVVGEHSGAMIDCPRGIPFRLKLVDEAGMPIEASVEYRAIMPNPSFDKRFQGMWIDGTFPLSRAVMTSNGIYEGIAIPGPGAVLVTTPGWANYRAAHVDPKAFFAPGRSEWTNQELISAYGTEDTLIVGKSMDWVDQHDYAAIVLVNPPVDSKPLALSATVFRDRPRIVTILDPDGTPVVGVHTRGLTAFPSDTERPLRAATVPITKLRATRSRRITLVKADRKLIGFLLARGDGEAPYTVRLQPWATLTGRIVDENGNPLAGQKGLGGVNGPAALLGTNNRLEIATHDNPEVGWIPDLASDSGGRFRIEQLVPGLSYTCEMYHGAGQYAGIAFENLVLKPGETRDLGDIRSKKPVDIRGK
jgi:hypothetical protein